MTWSQQVVNHTRTNKSKTQETNFHWRCYDVLRHKSCVSQYVRQEWLVGKKSTLLKFQAQAENKDNWNGTSYKTCNITVLGPHLCTNRDPTTIPQIRHQWSFNTCGIAQRLLELFVYADTVDQACTQHGATSVIAEYRQTLINKIIRWSYIWKNTNSYMETNFCFVANLKKLWLCINPYWADYCILLQSTV